MIHVWRMPALLTVVTLFGLVSALLVDGAADAIGWVALSVPVVVTGWFALNKGSIR